MSTLQDSRRMVARSRLFDIIDDPEMRFVVDQVGDANEEVNVEDLAHGLAFLETDAEDIFEVEDKDKERFEIRLEAAVLPELDHNCIVEYDRDHDRVIPTTVTAYARRSILTMEKLVSEVEDA